MITKEFSYNDEAHYAHGSVFKKKAVDIKKLDRSLIKFKMVIIFFNRLKMNLIMLILHYR